MDITEELRVEQSAGVGIITLHRPDRLNTWTPAMEDGLHTQLHRWAADDSVRVILLTGAGRAFCAGADMDALKAATATGTIPPRERVEGDLAQRYSYLMGIPQPIVCALNGAAAGVGVVLSLYCDIRIAARSARMAAVFARRGLVAEHGIAWLLPRLVGHARAMEWLLTARTLSAAEAEQMGLVSRVFDDTDFPQAALAHAQDLATQCSPRATRIIKRQLVNGLRASLAQCVHEAEDELAGCVQSEDFKEGVRHFVEKRPPEFTGR